MRDEIEREMYPFGQVESELPHWFYLMDSGELVPKAPNRMLVPLDGSIKAAEGVLNIAQDILGPEGEGTLLHVIPPGQAKTVGLRYVSAKQAEKENWSLGMGFLKYFANQLNKVSGQWRYEVVVSHSVAEAIADFAFREEVDLIAMYTHDRKGLAKLIKGSVTQKVQERTPTEVRVVRPSELVAV